MGDIKGRWESSRGGYQREGKRRGKGEGVGSALQQKRASIQDEAIKLGDVGFATAGNHKGQYGRKT